MTSEKRFLGPQVLGMFIGAIHIFVKLQRLQRCCMIALPECDSSPCPPESVPWVPGTQPPQFPRLKHRTAKPSSPVLYKVKGGRCRIGILRRLAGDAGVLWDQLFHIRPCFWRGWRAGGEPLQQLCGAVGPGTVQGVQCNHVCIRTDRLWYLSPSTLLPWHVPFIVSKPTWLPNMSMDCGGEARSSKTWTVSDPGPTQLDGSQKHKERLGCLPRISAL